MNTPGRPVSRPELAVGKGVHAITSHWFMGDRGKMGRGWKLSCLEAVQDSVPEETQVNRFTPQNMMDLRQLCGDECGQRNIGNTVRSNRSQMMETHKNMKNSHNCNTESSWWTCSWSTNKFRNTILKSLNSGESMTTQADAVDAVLSINWGKWWNCKQRAQVCTAAFAGGSISPISPLRPNNCK